MAHTLSMGFILKSGSHPYFGHHYTVWFAFLYLSFKTFVDSHSNFGVQIYNGSHTFTTVFTIRLVHTCLMGFIQKVAHTITTGRTIPTIRIQLLVFTKSVAHIFVLGFTSSVAQMVLRGYTSNTAKIFLRRDCLKAFMSLSMPPLFILDISLLSFSLLLHED